MSEYTKPEHCIECGDPISICRCPSCGQEMRGTDYLARLRNSHVELRELLMEARKKIPHDSEAAAKIDKYLKLSMGAG